MLSPALTDRKCQQQFISISKTTRSRLRALADLTIIRKANSFKMMHANHINCSNREKLRYQENTIESD